MHHIRTYVAWLSLFPLSILAPSSIPLTIATAEAEGAAFSRNPAQDTTRAAMLARLPGTAERKCMRPERTDREVRTGDFAVGAGISRLLVGRSTKIWWAPAHDPSPTGEVLHLRAARLGSDATAPDTLRRQLTDVAWSVTEPRTAFFPGTLQFPRRGEWLVVATSGQDWGCIVLRVE